MTESYLAICDFSGGVSNTGKIRRHIGPLAEQTETTVVCVDPGEREDHITYHTTPAVGVRLLNLILLFVVALAEGMRNDYDGVVSISLVPYGCFALLVGRLCGVPTHLAIIGIDLDVHAYAAYRTVVAALFPRFDSLSVPGTEHKQQLRELGVPPSRITVLTNAINTETYRPNETPTENDYDYIWVGRFTTEKDPLLFVETMAELHRAGARPHAVMLGSGPLQSDVSEYVRTHSLENHIDLPGWVDEPVEYYHRSATFVLTSERDALPLTLLEAMSVGLACVVPDVGNVRDAVTDGKSGIILATRDTKSFAMALQRLHSNDELYERISTNASAVGSRFSYERAAEDWEEVRHTLQAA
jgi:glycosyltransferase involved in cell wall biosynthesis